MDRACSGGREMDALHSSDVPVTHDGANVHNEVDPLELLEVCLVVGETVKPYKTDLKADIPSFHNHPPNLRRGSRGSGKRECISLRLLRCVDQSRTMRKGAVISPWWEEHLRCHCSGKGRGIVRYFSRPGTS